MEAGGAAVAWLGRAPLAFVEQARLVVPVMDAAAVKQWQGERHYSQVQRQ
jgi:hypothetical protein